MSQMSAPRSSVFTFESTVHSSHVLQWLNEQRCRDLLCDVTVVVEAQSFRAHRSVLASCSEYFAQKISSLTQHGAVINLTEEVTVVGFEPLLKFAYTSKLHFGKEDVLEIQNSASILGFRDLDEACFDFLLPKLLACNKDPAPFVRKTCCKKTWKRQLSVENGGTDSVKVLLDDKEVKPVADSSSQQDVTWDCGKSGSKKTGSLNNAKPLGTAVEDIDGIIQQCPKYRKFQQACKKELVAEKSPTDVRKPVIEDGCFLSCSPCPSSAQCKIKTAVLGNSASNKKIKGNAKEPHETEEHKVKSENSGATQGVDIVKKNTLEREENFHENALENNMERLKEQMMEHSSSSDTLCVKIVSSESNPRLDESPLEVLQPRCFVRDLSEGQSICRSPSHEKTVNITENPEARNPSVADSGAIQTVPIEAEGTRPRSVCQDGGNGRQTDNMQRAAIFVENTRERSNSQPNFQDPEVRYSPDAVGRWSPSLLQDNLCPTKNNCPCLLDLDQASCSLNPAGMSECEAASQSGVSSLNSGEDGDSETETEGDCELYTRERAMQVQLPYPVDWIVNLSRNDFQHLLKQQPFTREQLDFVHDMRRRSKNRLAAQRCRKRKLDCIYNLQCEINKLKTQKEKLIMEKNQLSQMKSNTCHSVSTLCQRVCSEANLQPDQLQVLTKYTFSDCPLTSFFPHIDALLSQHGFPLHPFRLPCSADLEFVASKEDPSGANGDTVTRKHAL